MIDGRLTRAVLSDTIAARFCWQLLGSPFSAAIYPHLTDAELAEDASTRANLLLPEGSVEDARADGSLHDLIGWTVFLQELLGLPDWSGNVFYDPAVPHPYAAERPAAGARERVELSHELATLTGVESEIEIEATIGGASAVIVALEAEEGIVSAARIRAAMLDSGGSSWRGSRCARGRRPYRRSLRPAALAPAPPCRIAARASTASRASR